MIAINKITDKQLDSLLKGKIFKKYSVLEKIVEKYKVKEHWKEDNQALYHGIIYMHTENIITLNAKQLQKVIKLKNEVAR